MQTNQYLLAIDQGTTSSRAIIFDKQGQIIANAQQELPQHYPHSGWVEHDATQIWAHVQTVIQDSVQKAIQSHQIDPTNIVAAGITNQRETTVIWDKKTGQPIHNAIVWQDRRTSEWCRAHHSEAVENMIRNKTGLVLDPYFSATKIAWILDRVPNARQRAEQGELAFGTIETWLLWNLTNGISHCTDASNAARTLLYNIHTSEWDAELLQFFNIPKNILPTVVDCAGNMGTMDATICGAAIPICGMAGDQQAATFGQACFETGMLKSTYGTGCFMVLNTGDVAVTSQNRLLTTVAWRLHGKTTFALEGSIFVAGAAVQWLRDAVKLIDKAGDSEMWARTTQDTGGVYLVPAFTGLGAPYWDPDARGAILGLSRDSGIGHIVKAALEAVCYQTRDLLNAMREDGVALQELRVDGGMVVNNWLTQALADVLQLPVIRPKVVETTALGAAFLAGLGCGLYQNLAEIAALWQTEHAFQPEMAPELAQTRYAGWQKAVARVRS